MSIRPSPKTERLVNRGLGASLVLLGVTFLGLGIVLVFHHELHQLIYSQGGLFAVVLGATLVWSGWKFLIREPDAHGGAHRESELPIISLMCRGMIELFGAAGCGLMLAYAVALAMDWRWPPEALLWVLVRAPIILGLLTFTILASDAFERGLFPQERWSGWAPLTRRLVLITVRLGWLGYIPVLLVVFRLSAILSTKWERGANFILAIAVSLLYASQVLIVRFGRLRD